LRVAVSVALASAACSGGRAPAARGGPSKAVRASLEPISAAAYGHYLRGRLAAIEGDDARAAAELRAAALAAPREAPIQVALADALLRSGRRDQALRTIETAQLRFPRDPGVWQESGRIYRRASRHVDASRAYGRAIELDPDDERSYLGLAAVWIARQRPDRAEATCRALLRRLPHSVSGHYQLGARLLARGALTEAERSLRRALDLDPSQTRARVALARVLRARGRTREALALLREAFDRSSSPQIGARLFEQLLEVGDRSGAVALVGQLDRDDLPLDVRVSFGYLYLQVGEAAQARALAARLAALEPTSGAVRLLEARALVDLDRRGDAIKILMAVGSERPGHADCRALAAELLARSGKHAEARAAIEQALALHPRDNGLVISRSLVAELAGKPGDAREIFNSALVGGRKHDPELLYALASLEDRHGDPDRAVAVAQRILDRDPDHAGALNFIGFSLADRNRELARADRLLQRALELAPTDGFVLDSVGWLRFRQGRLPEAQDLLERAVRLAPTEPEMLWHLGEVYLARQLPRRALTAYERARLLGPEEPVKRRIDARINALRAER
jgi:tetratricopeptide (TPR) repeat protein